jgi:phosphohistidine phosphatase
MMKTLYLLRHAKSSWKDETLSDVERPLNDRGRKASKAIGGFLKNENIVPDLVLSSPAVRARQTTDIVMEAAKLESDLRFDERIYEASAQRLMEVLKQIDRSKKAVLLVGHNPGLEDFLELLTGNVETMPTGTLSKVVLTASNWTAIEGKAGKLAWIVTPKHMKML